MITLFLMTKKGFSVLNRLIGKDLAGIIDFVVVGKDKNTLKDYSEDIIRICESNNLKWFDRQSAPSVKSPFSMAISWRWMIREQSSQLIVLHDSLLPRYRGFAPLVNQLINGETKIGVTALFASSEYDKGPVISQKSININYPIKIEKAISLVSGLYADLVEDIILAITAGRPLPQNVQDESLASYSLWRDEDDYRIDWSSDAETICRHIDAVGFPYLGAVTSMGSDNIRILDAEVTDDLKVEIRHPGKVIFFKDDKPVVVCGQGLIKINTAVYDTNGASIFPLIKFRIRFR